MNTIVLKPGPPQYNFGVPRFYAVDDEVASVLWSLTGRKSDYIEEDHIEALRALGLPVEIQEAS